MLCVAFVRIHLSTDEKFHFVLPLHSTHQIPPREGTSATAHIGYQVKHISLQPQNRLWDKMGVLQKPPPFLVDCYNKWDGLQPLKERCRSEDTG